MAKIVIIDDEPAMVEVIVTLCREKGHQVFPFNSAPKAIEPNKPLTYRITLPTANHVFLPGHKIMVQIQSSWFPLYDRNPQTFVPNIFWAKPGDYKRAVQRVYHSAGQASFVELPVVKDGN